MPPTAPGDLIDSGTPATPEEPGDLVAAGGVPTPDEPLGLIVSRGDGLSITGTLTDGTNPLIMPDLLPVPDFSGRRAWSESGLPVTDEESGSSVYWSGGIWQISYTDGENLTEWWSIGDAPSPAEVEEWDPRGSATGQPVVTLEGATAAAELIDSGTPATPDAPGELV
jgi:hypothetical protein